MRVHELAKEFGIKSTEFVDIVQGFGIGISSHLSGLDNAQVSDIRHKMILRKEFESENIDDMNPIAVDESSKVNDGGETPQDFNARRREEIAEEKKRVANRERASQVIERANENKKEQLLKLERAGFWGWIKGLFS